MIYRLYTEKDLKKLSFEHIKEYYIELYEQLYMICLIYPDIKKIMKPELEKVFKIYTRNKLNKQRQCSICKGKRLYSYGGLIQHYRSNKHRENVMKQNKEPIVMIETEPEQKMEIETEHKTETEPTMITETQPIQPAMEPAMITQPTA